MTQYFSSISKQAIFLMACFVFVSCEKDFGEIGLDQVENQIPNLRKYSNAAMVTYHNVIDSVSTGNSNTTLLGMYSDPIFGEASSKIGFEILLEQVSPSFETGAIVDSVIFYLDTENAYGDTTVLSEFDLYEIDQSFEDFVSGRDQLSFGSLIQSFSFFPRPQKPQKDTTGAIISRGVQKISLDPNFFQTKFLQGAIDNPTDFSSNENFKSYFPGFGLDPTNGGSILYCDFRGGLSKIVMYYSEPSTPGIAQDYTFIFSQLQVSEISQTAEDYTLDYSMAAFDPSITDPVMGEGNNYIQTMGGPGMAIDFKELNKLKDSVLVNKAELIIPVEDGTIEMNGITYSPPSLLFVFEQDEEGNLAAIKDYCPLGNCSNLNIEAVGGRLIKGEATDSAYSFTITRYIHDAIYSGNQPKTLVISHPSRANAAERVVLNGNLNINPCRLDIYYTKIKSNPN